jgi:hypothetical protein
VDGVNVMMEGENSQYRTAVAGHDIGLLYEFWTQRKESNLYGAGRIYYVTETCDDTSEWKVTRSKDIWVSISEKKDSRLRKGNPSTST